MRFDLLQEHLNRRQLLGAMGKAGAAGAAAAAAGGVLLSSPAGGQPVAAPEREGSENLLGPAHGGRYDDFFSITGAKSGEWAEETSARYGADDQRGTLNEITPQKTASALALLNGADQVHAYGLGHMMRNGMPAFVNFPPRVYSQRIYVLGFNPEQGQWFTAPADQQDQSGIDAWRAADLASEDGVGYLASSTPLAANEVSSCEERFLHGGTYQIATQFDHFPHFGVGDILYNGFKASEIATPTGFTKLGMEHVGPFVTRGVLIDVLGWKKARQGGADVQTIDGHDMLTDTYRITVDDIRQTLRWEGVRRLLPGDALLIRTGWWWLAEDPNRHEKYLASHPGIYLAEAKFLGDHLPALIGSDAWALEVVGDAELWGDLAFPVHTELLVRRGIHIGESIITHELAEKGIYRFVYSYSPQFAQGATAGNTPPVALATR